MHPDKPVPFEKRTVFTAHGIGDLGAVVPAVAIRAGVQPGPIRLLNGVQGAKGGFGRIHIESYDARMRQLRSLGFRDAISYVSFVAGYFEFLAIQPDGRIVIVRRSGNLFHHVVCQWDNPFALWSVTTAIPKNNMRNLSPVWSARRDE